MIQQADPTRRRWTLVATTLLTVAVAAGCGSSGATSSSSTTAASGSADRSTTSTAGDAGTSKTGGGACDIVSDDVVTKVLGVDIERREPHGSAGDASVSCIKGLARTSDLSTISYVNVAVMANGGALVDQASGEAGSQPVAGLGDKAVYVPSAGALFISVGTDAVQVQVVKGGAPGTQQDAVAIAHDVLDRRS